MPGIGGPESSDGLRSDDMEQESARRTTRQRLRVTVVLGNGWGIDYQPYFKYCSYGINGFIKDRKIDTDFRRPAEIIAFQDHVEQKLDNNGDMFHVKPGDNINLTQWRPPGPYGNFPEAVQECFRHLGISNTGWLDGHVSEIGETTGENVPWQWYTGVSDESVAASSIW